MIDRSAISWTICVSFQLSIRQILMPAPHYFIFTDCALSDSFYILFFYIVLIAFWLQIKLSCYSIKALKAADDILQQ